MKAPCFRCGKITDAFGHYKPAVHMLSACKLLTDEQTMHICLILGAEKCIRDTDTMTYYFHLKHDNVPT